jgi:hypothetical protein
MAGDEGGLTMADLISRAAAIDAIVSVTVFQDADYIKKLCENPSNSEDWLGGVCEAINAVEEVNSIDAIPVAWLNQKYAENEPGEDKDYDFFLWDAIQYILTEWQKEQEAR